MKGLCFLLTGQSSSQGRWQRSSEVENRAWQWRLVSHLDCWRCGRQAAFSQHDRTRLAKHIQIVHVPGLFVSLLCATGWPGLGGDAVDLQVADFWLQTSILMHVMRGPRCSFGQRVWLWSSFPTPVQQDDGSGRQRWLVGFEAPTCSERKFSASCSLNTDTFTCGCVPGRCRTTYFLGGAQLQRSPFGRTRLCNHNSCSSHACFCFRREHAAGAAPDLYISFEHGLSLYAHRLDSHANVRSGLSASCDRDCDGHIEGSGARWTLRLEDLPVRQHLVPHVGHQ